MIKGRVTDASGAPLYMANVFISDAAGKITPAAVGTATDENGFFEIDPKGGQFITASYVGFKPVVTNVREQVSFKLEPNASGPTSEIKSTRTYYWLIALAVLGFFAYKKLK